MTLSEDSLADDHEWIDLGGQLMPRTRLQQFQADIEDERIVDINGCHQALQSIADDYAKDEWDWVCQAYRSYFDLDLRSATAARLHTEADRLLAKRREFLELVLVDARKEFESSSRLGFGTHGDADAVELDFSAVRGDYETNRFVAGIREELAALSDRVTQFKELIR